jgi:ATP-binding protein involved in chromosome partitioning
MALDGRTLRWACPCAECRGELGEPGKLDRAETLAPDEERLRDVWLVGQYALGIGFESGHATGIYTFELLRRLGTRA